ncbi:MAG: hydantoinase/oxoprolinase family protein [Methylocystaceae bacterium]
MIALHIGIDVGGTFTDGVLLDGGQVIRTTKIATDHNDLKGTLMEALDVLISGAKPQSVERLVLSTTLITNTIATDSGEPTGLMVIPGPGMLVSDLGLPGYAEVLSGAVDFRGRITEPLNDLEIAEAVKRADEQGIRTMAVVSKFSGRNPELELEVARKVQTLCPQMKTVIGSSVAGGLNFPRRVVTTYYTAMTISLWQQFTQALEDAVKARGIVCPISVLKADGGIIDLASSLAQPCETIFSGPAASAMGAIAMVNPTGPAVVVDIGGTTTDLALILDGEPLLASRGARILGRYSQIHSVAVSSLPLGGDSLVALDKSREVVVGPKRVGSAACYGGSNPTPTDAYNIINRGIFGNLDNSEDAFRELALACNLSLSEIAAETLRVLVGGIYDGILTMFRNWEEEPAYKVWEIVNRRKIKPQVIIGVGAAAKLAVPNLATLFAAQPILHAYTPVGNAIGAAVARATLQLKLHVDTTTGRYNCDLDGLRGEVPRRFTNDDAVKLAEKLLITAANLRQMEIDPETVKWFMNEQFNVIRGWDSAGKIYDIGVKIAAGVIPEYRGAI